MGICCSRKVNTSLYSTLRRVQLKNIMSHYTDMYNWPGLIFRRGVTFDIEVSTGDCHIHDSADVILHLTIGGIGGKKIILDKNCLYLDSFGWDYKVVSSYGFGDKICLSLTSPADATVGKYTVVALLNGKEAGSTEFLLLFNPFNPDDDVYMPDFDDRQEYLFNDSTKIYMGTEDYIIPKEWDLGQFEPSSIEAVIMLLNKMPITCRSSAIDVSRQLSALINANDDSGVLVGNWSGKYFDGVNPMAWNNSVDILSRYVLSGRPVKYGQCWVFCGVLTTVLRALGIPARCVTNYCSLHDTDGSLKWEIFLDENFNPINTGGDSCWNFHCWNESWTKRPDIGSEHDGWQVLDATPQERSGGLFRLGPASRTAVKYGMLKLPYDVAFVYAEVNADKVFYLRLPDGGFKQYMVKKNELGRKVLTKKKLSDDFEDITADYKCMDEGPMDSLIDREHSLMRFTENSLRRRIRIDINCPPNLSLAENLCGNVLVTGLTDRGESRIKIQATLVSYTGKNICRLYESTEKIHNSSGTVSFKIRKDQIGGSVNEEFPSIKLKVFCFDSNNDEMAYSERIISVRTPDIEILGCPSECRVDIPVVCTISVLNTLNRPLTRAKLRINFTDDKPRKVKLGDILPGNKVEHRLLLNPKIVGLKKLRVSLDSKECSGFSNIAKFKVTF